MKRSILIIFILTQALEASAKKHLCLKPNQSMHSLIYLHGLDATHLSNQEKLNRKMLKKLSTDLQITIVAPRARTLCQNKLCWLHGTAANRAKEWRYIKQSLQNCSPKQEADYILGFSNGGYLAGKLALDCILSQNARTYIVGATISEEYIKTKGRAKCRHPLVFHMGKHDQIYKRANRAFRSLLKNGYPVFWREFEGRHELKYSELIRMFTKKF